MIRPPDSGLTGCDSCCGPFFSIVYPYSVTVYYSELAVQSSDRNRQSQIVIWSHTYDNHKIIWLLWSLSQWPFSFHRQVLECTCQCHAVHLCSSDQAMRLVWASAFRRWVSELISRQCWSCRIIKTKQDQTSESESAQSAYCCTQFRSWIFEYGFDQKYYSFHATINNINN